MAELRVKSTGTIKLFENDNTSSVTIASPASLGADRTITLPDANVTLASGTMSTFNPDGAVTINDSGADVDFTVEGSGDADLFFVNGGTNRIGINAGATPEAKLHIIAAGASEPAAYFEQNSANDAMVLINNSRADDGAEISLKFNRADAVQGAIGTTGNGLNFWTGSSLGNRMRIDSNGDVGIGTTNPTTKLYVSSSDNATSSYFENGTSSGYDKSVVKITGAQTTTDASYVLFEAHNGDASGKLVIADDGDVTNTNNSYGAISDERIKQNITDASSQWDDIKALKIKNFKLKSNTDLTLLGVVAQDLETDNMNGLVEETKPSKEDVAYSADFGTIEAGTEDNGAEAIKDDDGNITGYEDVFTEGQKVKSVKYSVLYMKAIKCLQEAMEKIETLETKVTALENA